LFTARRIAGKRRDRTNNSSAQWISSHVDGLCFSGLLRDEGSYWHPSVQARMVTRAHFV